MYLQFLPILAVTVASGLFWLRLRIKWAHEDSRKAKLLYTVVEQQDLLPDFTLEEFREEVEKVSNL